MSTEFVAPCGLYCGVCLDRVVNKVCHGCGCTCGACAGQWHHEHCDISQCTVKRRIETCADCDDFPCSRLIKFTFEPCGENHRSVLENLRRIQKVGKARFLAEQEELFADDKARYSWAFAEHEAGERWQRFERWMKQAQEQHPESS